MVRCGYGTQRENTTGVKIVQFFKKNQYFRRGGGWVFLYTFLTFPTISILLTNLPSISNRLYPQDSFLRHKLFADDVSEGVCAEGCKAPYPHSSMPLHFRTPHWYTPTESHWFTQYINAAIKWPVSVHVWASTLLRCGRGCGRGAAAFFLFR